MSGVNVPSLVTLPDVEVFTLYRLLLFTELGCWFNELLEVAADVEDLGWVVEVISEPMEALPLSELALQFPLDECGSSLLPNLLNRLCVELSLNFTAMLMTCDKGLTGMFMLDFSDDDIEELRSCVLLSFSKSRFRFIVTVSYRLISSIFSLLFISGFPSALLFMSLSYLLLPHCLRVLKCDFLSTDSFLVDRKRSLLLLRMTAPDVEHSSISWVCVGEDGSSLLRNFY